VVFSLKLLQAPQFAAPQASILLLPAVKGLLGNAHLPDNFLHRSAVLGLLQGIRYLLPGTATPLHGKILLIPR